MKVSYYQCYQYLEHKHCVYFIHERDHFTLLLLGSDARRALDLLRAKRAGLRVEM